MDVTAAYPEPDTPSNGQEMPGGPVNQNTIYTAPANGDGQAQHTSEWKPEDIGSRRKHSLNPFTEEAANVEDGSTFPAWTPEAGSTGKKTGQLVNQGPGAIMDSDAQHPSNIPVQDYHAMNGTTVSSPNSEPGMMDVNQAMQETAAARPEPSSVPDINGQYDESSNVPPVAWDNVHVDSDGGITNLAATWDQSYVDEPSESIPEANGVEPRPGVAAPSDSWNDTSQLHTAGVTVTEPTCDPGGWNQGVEPTPPAKPGLDQSAWPPSELGGVIPENSQPASNPSPTVEAVEAQAAIAGITHPVWVNGMAQDVKDGLWAATEESMMERYPSRETMTPCRSVNSINNSTSSLPIVSHGMPPLDGLPANGKPKQKPFFANMASILKFPHGFSGLGKSGHSRNKMSSSCTDVPQSHWNYSNAHAVPPVRRSSSLEQKLLAISRSKDDAIRISPEDLSPVEVVGGDVRPRRSSDTNVRSFQGPVKKSVMIADPSTTQTRMYESEYEPNKSPRSPLGPESDESYYDTVSSTCSTASLLRKAVHDSEADALQEAGSHPTVYDTVSSTSSGAALLKEGLQVEVLNADTVVPPVLIEAAEDLQNDEYVDLVQGGQPGPCLGQALLAKTLEHVKQSLEEIGPSILSSHQDLSPIENMDKIRNTYVKNLIVLSIGFMLTYTAFFSLRNLQSSINHDGGLGLFSLSAMYVTFVLGCIFATTIVQNSRPKHAIVVSMLGMLVYIISQFYPALYTLVPSAALLGFAMAVMWTAQGTYITSIAITYATAADMNHVGILGLFNGFFLFLIQVAQILGNLIASAIFNIELTFTDPEPEMYVYANTTEAIPMAQLESEQSKSICGSRYCHIYQIEHTGKEVERHMVYILLGVFTGCTLIGIIILAASLDKLDIIFRKKSKMSTTRQIFALFHLHGNRKLLCLLPLTIFLGMEEAYMFGEFTKAFITCPLGLHMIGYVMMCFGACDACSSFFFGNLQKYVHRSVLVAFAACMNTSLLIIMYLWEPNPDQDYVVFLLAGAWGMADGIWQTQICSLCGLLFANQREAAFASLRMYESLGFVIAFAYAQFFCMDVKILLVGVLLLAGLIGYTALEIIHKRTYISEAHVRYV